MLIPNIMFEKIVIPIRTFVTCQRRNFTFESLKYVNPKYSGGIVNISALELFKTRKTNLVNHQVIERLLLKSTLNNAKKAKIEPPRISK